MHRTALMLLLLALALATALGCGGHSSAGYGTTSSYGEPAGSRSRAAEPDPSTRPGLATEWGEQRRSVTRSTRFVRANGSPLATATLHYNDASGAAAQAALRAQHGGEHLGIGGEAHRVVVTLVDESGYALPAYRVDGHPYVVGQPGRRYAIRVDNHTPYRFELVMSVDGLDVIDGREAGFDRRGYVIGAGESSLIEGFRTSDRSVAAFRFGSVADSYAARSTGSARNVGVVGVALFAEAGVSVDLYGEAMRREQADPFPSGRRYAAPPRY